jgi:hypothetical protein
LVFSLTAIRERVVCARHAPQGRKGSAITKATKRRLWLYGTLAFFALAAFVVNAMREGRREIEKWQREMNAISEKAAEENREDALRARAGLPRKDRSKDN